MSRKTFITAVALIVALAGYTVAVRAQRFQRAYRLNDRQVEEIIHRVENDAKSFRQSLDHALDRSRLNGTEREDDVNARVKDFEDATKQLHDNFDGHRSAASDVQNVLTRAARIDEFVRRHSLDQRAQRDWSTMRGDLDRLASAYDVTWRWDQAYLPIEGQPRPYRVSDRQVKNMLNRTEKDADAFRQSLDHALDRSRLNNTAREDDVNQFVKDFRDATKQLRDHFNGHASVAADVEAVLGRAGRIDNFMMRHRLDERAQRDWTRLRSDLDQLASTYNVTWNWDNRPYGIR